MRIKVFRVKLNPMSFIFHTQSLTQVFWFQQFVYHSFEREQLPL